MPPEQVLGGSVDATADLFALGVLLYEMLSGERPFQGETRSELIAAILSKEPPPLSKIRSDVPRELSDLVSSLLAKEKGRRIGSAEEVLAILREIGADSAAAIRIFSGSMRAVRRGGRKARIAAIALIGVAVLSSAILYALHRTRIRGAEASVVKASALAGADRYAEAYDWVLRGEAAVGRRARGGAPHLDDDEAGREERSARRERFSAALRRTFRPDARGLDSARGAGPARRLHRDARKKGYAPALRTFSAMPITIPGGVEFTPDSIDATLIPTSEAPEGMVAVDGGPYRLRSWYRPSDKPVTLSHFFLDRREVTNGKLKSSSAQGVTGDAASGRSRS